MGVIEASGFARKGVQMTEEKQGAAEWLRKWARIFGSADAYSCKKFMADEFGVSCSRMRCTDCNAVIFERIADRIESERQLPEGVEWPRFEDGELVKVGDTVSSDELFTVEGIAFEPERWTIKARSGSAYSYFYGAFGEPVKCPTPKVLGADGAPINVGDMVYFVGGSGTRFAVKDIDFKPDGAFVDIIDEDRYSATVNPESLTHKRPDSWERLEADARKIACDYAPAPHNEDGLTTCDGCPFQKSESCSNEMTIDLVERAKKLAGIKDGGSR